MTTLSVMAALLPIASGLEEGSELLQSVALVLIGGLVTSTLLTLVFVPAMYTIFDDITGKAKDSPRNALFYFSDDGDVIAVRVGDYKFSFGVQRASTMKLWQEPFVKLRMPSIFHLRRDPFERADMNSNTYMDWLVDHVPQLYQVQELVAQQISDFVAFPPRQKPASFNLDTILEVVSHHGHS
jgi:hypothetical protein